MDNAQDEIFWEFVEEGQELLADLENCLGQLESDPQQNHLTHEAFRAIHTLKGNSSCFDLENMTQLAHVLEDVLGLMRDEKITASTELIQDLIEGVDKIGLMLSEPENMQSVECENIKTKFESYLGQSRSPAETTAKPAVVENPFRDQYLKSSHFVYWIRFHGTDDAAVENELSQMGTVHNKISNQDSVDFLYETVLDKTFLEVLEYDLPVIEEIDLNSEKLVEKKKEKLKEAPQKAKVTAESTGAKQENFARISYQLLDKLIELSGELILCRNQFVRKLERDQLQDFHALSVLINDMQDGLMMTRMQPFSVVSGKFPRMIRDTARKLSKKVNFEVFGDWVEMDRTILEGAKAIFTHILRNSLDHGIERSEDRLANGKSSEGNLKISVSQNTGFVQFIVEDDGKGIDPEKIKEKALANGLITQEQAANMDDDKAVNLVYMPGFSTAGQISDVSGRGVGMDVVKTEVEKLGGSINLESVLGQGTKITIKLPQSMAILHSLVVKSGNHNFAIPRNNISEVLKISDSDLGQFQEVEGSTLLRHRGRLLPLLQLDKIVENSLSRTEVTTAKQIDQSSTPLTVIVIKQMDKAYGLIVDEVLYQEEVVIKPLNEFLESFRIFTGMTILSTGKVCFILDVHQLAEKGGVRHSDVVSLSAQKSVNLETDSFFVFENCENEHFAVPIGQVAMIHQLQKSELARCGDEYFINIHDDEYRIIDLQNHVNSREYDMFSNDSLYIIRLKGILGQWVIGCRKLIGTKDYPKDIHLLSSSSEALVGQVIKDQTVTNFLDILSLDLKISGHTKKLEYQSKKILVVDDSRLVRNILTQFLTKTGYDVVAAENGRDALTKLSSINDFNLIMSDLEMPQMDGFELAAHLKEHSIGHVPLLALTSLNSEASKNKALNAGFDDYLLKFNSETLLETLEKHIA